MTALDWLVLVGTTAWIVVVGLLRTRAAKTTSDYLKGGNEQRWASVAFGVMATQASAITFLSTPGQAYEDGMRFVQFYFGLPLAMIVVSAIFVPLYFKAGVTTAYELLEARFDLKTRLLGAALFLVQRGLAAGITIYAPSIILSTILGWPLEPTIAIMGGLVVLYTVTGGAKAVAATQRAQMVIMLGGMAIAGVVVALRLPDAVSLGGAVDVAGALGRMNVVDFELNWESRYNVWSGLTGGFFLALSYFGTDQSQVGRYLGGRNVAQSRMGLLLNGVLKIPMQAGILFIGVLVFAFYQFSTPPLIFNEPLGARARAAAPAAYDAIEARWRDVQARKQTVAARVAANDDEATKASLRALHDEAAQVRKEAKELVARVVPGAETKDSDYVFIGFVKRWLPSGLFGLLVSVILAAAMSSTASELQALGATTTVDFWRRLRRKDADDASMIRAGKAFTVAWGVVAVAFASTAKLLDNLIQAVNILGSIFYGTVLGLFLVAFFVRRVGGTAVFWAAVVAETTVVALFFTSEIGFLWFNVIGCALVVGLSVVLQALMGRRAR